MTNPIPAPIPPSSRAAINRANSQHSTGPRTPAGKQRSSLNALRHGLTAASPVLPSEDHAAYDNHRRGFFDEYRPATPTESQLVEELASSSWRLNRIPLLEADLLSRAAAPVPPDHEITFDIVDAHRLIANLAIQSQRLSRQFHRSLDQLRDIQAVRSERERRDLKDAAALLELHKHRGIPWNPADHGFVFSKDHVERFAQRLQDLNQSRHIEYVLFHMPPAVASEAPSNTSLGAELFCCGLHSACAIVEMKDHVGRSRNEPHHRERRARSTGQYYMGSGDSRWRTTSSFSPNFWASRSMT